MKHKNIETIYKLSPMQHGMLFHTILEPTAGIYCLQFSCILQGDLNLAAFKQAWQLMLERHAVLRTGFYWENLEKPIQAVHHVVPMPWHERDWRTIPLDEQPQQLEQLLQADRQQGFELTQPPLTRWYLIQRDADSFYFVWSIHQMVMDGWCRGLILDEFMLAYQAFCQGQTPILPRRRPYGDYLAWLRKQDLAAAEAFWQQQLHGFNAPTPLLQASGVGSSDAQATTYAEHYLELEPHTLLQLQQLARQHRLTLNTLVQGAWAILLSRYTREDDVVFGTTVSGRPSALAGSDTMVGLFINTLPVRVTLDPQQSLIQWLNDLQQQQVNLREYEYSPLLDIQRWSEIPRGMALFESLIVFENYPMQESMGTERNQLSIQAVTSIERTNYPLTLLVVPGQTLSITAIYAVPHFDQASIQRMLGHLQQLLTAMVEQPEQPLATIALLSQHERHQLLTTAPNTDREYDLNQPFFRLFEAQANHHPERIAVRDQTTSLSYQALDHQANQVANYLIQRGVTPHTLIGIMLERSVNMVVTLLGILKAGAAYVPLDPHYPSERLIYMLEDAGLKTVVTTAQFAQQLNTSLEWLKLDQDWAAIAQQPTTAPSIQLDAHSLAYTIYTSGSTGKPKGVQIEHGALTNFLLSMQERPGIHASDCLLSVTTLAFDIAGLELYLPLISGAELVVVSQATAADPQQLRDVLETQPITLMQATPATWQMLIQAGWQGNATLKLLCGGEALTPELAQALQPRCASLWNMYGPTETTIWSTVWNVSAGPIRLGEPIANTQIYILDQQLQPVPPGIAGELHIAGAGLARGYLQRPELTAEKFITYQLQPNQSIRLYKTGDLARFDHNGQLEHLGRIDQQVKMRGFRIELGEIESLLRHHPAISEVAVVLDAANPNDQRLVAYFSSNAAVSSAELRELLTKQLPRYMVPSLFINLAALPRTPNGKLDRRALPAPDQHELGVQTGYVAPRTALEQQLATIWADVLNRETVGIEHNFFELGGHSFNALQILSRIQTSFQIQVPLRRFLSNPSIAQLANVIAIIQQTGSDAALDTLDQLDLAQEAQLEPTLSTVGVTPYHEALPQAILLTGATGFLGPFLLAELLKQTNAQIYCLVRAADQTQGYAKIRQQLEHYQRWESAFASRINVVLGDLAQPQLGIAAQEWQWLAETIDSIYHNGALVNFAYPYAALKPSNVQATQEIVRLASQTKIKAIHFSSTTSVFAAATHPDTVRYEAELPQTPTGLNGGYGQSKWVAEHLLLQARERGIPVNSYRSGRIGWDTQTGLWNSNDSLYRLIQGCLQLGSAPQVERLVEITPVDYVAQAMVALSLQPIGQGQAYHVLNPNRIQWNQLIRWMQELGYPIDHVDHDQWLAQLQALVQAQPNHALQPLLALAPAEAAEDNSYDQMYDQTTSQAGLAQTTIQQAIVDQALLQRFLGQLSDQDSTVPPALINQFQRTV
ncbi:amino acid adenylation domain-containing protein [Herpetosiphon sp. NSE202]|uniref:non-ribosomal peptide synthetase n=1 Tax=Herpetosiphon sp. NSE202 TaxID=3351349 RepID=UPI0036418D56